MKPVHYSLTPEHGFYKQTAAEWNVYFGFDFVDTDHTPITRREYLLRHPESTEPE